MKIPRARVKFTDSVQSAIDKPGEWVLYRAMSGTSALQSARKMNVPSVDGGVDNLVFGVDGEDLYVRYDG